MNGESICNCQRCSERIAFPSEMTGRDIVCPQCGRETTLRQYQANQTKDDSNLPASERDQKTNMHGERVILFWTLGIIAVAVPMLLYIHNKNLQQERSRNLQELLNPNPSYREQIDAQIAHDQEHEDFLYWGATNGWPDWQYNFATNMLYQERPVSLATDENYLNSVTNIAVNWLQKSAEQGYQPAIELLKKIQN